MNTRTPNYITREQWIQYYIRRYNKSLNPEAALMAMWYMFLELADDH